MKKKIPLFKKGDKVFIMGRMQYGEVVGVGDIMNQDYPLCVRVFLSGQPYELFFTIDGRRSKKDHFRQVYRRGETIQIPYPEGEEPEQLATQLNFGL